MKALKIVILHGIWIYFLSYLTQPFIYVIHANTIAREPPTAPKGQNGGNMDNFEQLSDYNGIQANRNAS